MLLAMAPHCLDSTGISWLRSWGLTSIMREKKRCAWCHTLSLSSVGRSGKSVKAGVMMLNRVFILASIFLLSWLGLAQE